MDLTAKCPLIPWAFCKDLTSSPDRAVNHIDPPRVPPRTREQRFEAAREKVLEKNAATFKKLAEVEAEERSTDPLEDELDRVVAKVEQRRSSGQPKAETPSNGFKEIENIGHGYAKLTPEIVRNAILRWDYGRGDSCTAIARELGVARNTISRAMRGITFPQVRRQLDEEAEAEDDGV